MLWLDGAVRKHLPAKEEHEKPPDGLHQGARVLWVTGGESSFGLTLQQILHQLLDQRCDRCIAANRKHLQLLMDRARQQHRELLQLLFSAGALCQGVGHDVPCDVNGMNAKQIQKRREEEIDLTKQSLADCVLIDLPSQPLQTKLKFTCRPFTGCTPSSTATRSPWLGSLPW